MENLGAVRTHYNGSAGKGDYGKSLEAEAEKSLVVPRLTLFLKKDLTVQNGSAKVEADQGSALVAVNQKEFRNGCDDKGLQVHGRKAGAAGNGAEQDA